MDKTKWGCLHIAAEGARPMGEKKQGGMTRDSKLGHCAKTWRKRYGPAQRLDSVGRSTIPTRPSTVTKEKARDRESDPVPHQLERVSGVRVTGPRTTHCQDPTTPRPKCQTPKARRAPTTCDRAAPQTCNCRHLAPQCRQFVVFVRLAPAVAHASASPSHTLAALRVEPVSAEGWKAKVMVPCS